MSKYTQEYKGFTIHLMESRVWDLNTEKYVNIKHYRIKYMGDKVSWLRKIWSGDNSYVDPHEFSSIKKAKEYIDG